MHPLALAMMTFLPRALHTSLTAKASPQPIQARCPGAKYSLVVINRGTYMARLSTTLLLLSSRTHQAHLASLYPPRAESALQNLGLKPLFRRGCLQNLQSL